MNVSGLHGKKQKVKHPSGLNKSIATRSPIPPAVVLVIIFASGVLACFALLCLFAVIMERASLPSSAARPMGLSAAGVGVIVSTAIAGGIVKKKHLLCGIGCSLFCLLCIVAATLICDGMISINNNTFVSVVTMLLCGALGGTLSAMSAGNAAVR